MREPRTRLRVALVRQRYNPHGGAERFIERALPALERSGVDVSLIARDWQGGTAELKARKLLLVNPFHVGSLWRDRSFARAAPVSLAGQLSLKELAALTRQARIFVGVDSAPMHIAASQGTPAVALFGPSGEIAWGPWRVAHRVVASQVHPCRPCGNDGCGGSKVSECLTTLPVARVLDAVQSLINETGEPAIA